MTDAFYFDATSAEKPIRWIEKFCIHTEGKSIGKPFILLDWQKSLIRRLFGEKRKDNGLRKYQELFLMSAKGSGKTPLLSAIGLYCLLCDGEGAPHIISLAGSYEQASYTFDFAKGYIENHPALSRHCNAQQYRIRASEWGRPNAPRNGKWTLMSGKPKGRSGSRPSCCIADEAHEWDSAAVESYNLVSANLFKRSQPLLLVATNAPKTATSFCHRLLERARAGTDETLLSVIYEAPLTLDWTSEASARLANPSIPEIITFDQLKPRLTKARETPQDEADYRRLYLSQLTQSGNNWLDVSRFDDLTQPIEPPKDSAVYIGIDLSEGAGDLCSVQFLYCTPEAIFVRSRFWLPKATAQEHEQRFQTPYEQWEQEQAITLTPELTINDKVQKQIAESIIDETKGHKVKAICYDRYRADGTISFLESKGLTCVPIGQGFGVSRGCEELDRRMREGTIKFEPSGVMRAHVEVVEVEYDRRGNYYPVKSGRKGKFAGKRSDHIDGVSALVSALTEARKLQFTPSNGVWTGTIGLLKR